MSTATDELLEIDVDLEKTVPCEATGCQSPAAWMIRPLPCGCQTLLCGEHHDEVRHLYEKWVAKDPTKISCTRCDCMALGVRWIKL